MNADGGALRVGVIGLGVGEQHIAGYEAAGGCELIALCDIDGERLAQVGARQPGVALTESAEDVLDDPRIDVVSIASYDDDHYEQVKRALERGKHVFVEKPVCLRREHADELHSLLVANPQLKLSSNLPLRASPRFRAVKEMLDAGEFGTPFYLEGDYDYGRLWKITEGWRGELDFYSVVLGGAVHVVDLLLWFTGARVREVSAVGNRIATEGTRFEFNDLVVATLSFEDGTIAKVGANFACVHPHYHGVKVFGTEATFVNALGPATIYRRDGQEVREESVEAAYPGVGKADLIPSFVASIRGQGPPAVTAAEAFEALAVCFAIDAAVESAAPVAVRPFGPDL